VDVAVQRETLGRRAMRLVAFDVDSTLIQGELIDEVAKVAGCGTEVAAITEAAMAGELDFEDALRARVALLKGLDATVLDHRRRGALHPGVRTLVTTLKRLGFTVVAFSGGFSTMTAIVGEGRLGLHATHANELGLQMASSPAGWSAG
jgi:phosphoserine phosphatase